MDARTGRPDPARIAVRISGIGEFAASIPHLLGFVPSESVVLVGLTGPRSGRLGLTVRVDIPPAEHERTVADEVVRRLLTDRPGAAMVALLSEVPDDEQVLPHRPLVRELEVALGTHGIAVPEIVLVRGGRWWSYDCPDPCCAPGRGTPLPDGVTELEVAAVATGMVVERDRDALAGRIAPPPGADARRAMAAACARAAVAHADGVLELGWEAMAERTWTAVLTAVQRSRPGPRAVRLTDDEVAALLWGLRDTAVRDRALELALGDDAPAAEQLWTECTRRAPAPLDAAPATLLAVSSWLRGDGAMADVALTRALDGAPGYGLARLLARGLAACLRPAELRELIRGTASDREG